MSWGRGEKERLATSEERYKDAAWDRQQRRLGRSGKGDCGVGFDGFGEAEVPVVTSEPTGEECDDYEDHDRQQ